MRHRWIAIAAVLIVHCGGARSSAPEPSATITTTSGEQVRDTPSTPWLGPGSPPLATAPAAPTRPPSAPTATAQDRDLDGVPDATDLCPTIPENRDGFMDEDGCPETIGGDGDADGVPDRIDRCPADPEDRDGFEDTDGCPEPDNDRDGVLDINDLCPNDPETMNGRADADGCPD